MEDFIDFYETLEVSPNANSETIERMFRYQARRFHPDNKASGDRARFDDVVTAYATLKDSVKRVQYDLEHKYHSNYRTRLAEEAVDSEGIARDGDVQNRLLSVLYVKRRRDIRDPGIGDAELERLLGCPSEHLEFHLWYLREKKWVMRSENGSFVITIDGVDRVNSELHLNGANKLLTDQS
jgi:curved DNA-binding protein CbpA